MRRSDGDERVGRRSDGSECGCHGLVAVDRMSPLPSSRPFGATRSNCGESCRRPNLGTRWSWSHRLGDRPGHRGDRRGRASSDGPSSRALSVVPPSMSRAFLWLISPSAGHAHFRLRRPRPSSGLWRQPGHDRLLMVAPGVLRLVILCSVTIADTVGPRSPPGRFDANPSERHSEARSWRLDWLSPHVARFRREPGCIDRGAWGSPSGIAADPWNRMLEVRMDRCGSWDARRLARSVESTTGT